MKQITPYRQRGITLSGVFMFMILMIFAAFIATRIVPGYVDYWTIQSIVKNLAEQPDVITDKESVIRAKFSKELQVNNIKTVVDEDLVIDRSRGGVQLSVVFSVKNPFIGPLSLCLDFRADASSN